MTRDRRVPRRRSFTTPILASVLTVAAAAAGAQAAQAASWSVKPVPTIGAAPPPIGSGDIAVATRADDGSSIALFTRVSNGATRVFSSGLSASGTWTSTAAPVSTGLGRATQHPAVAVAPGGRAVAVWVQQDGSGGDGVLASVRAPGGSWSAPVVLSTSSSAADVPSVVIDAKGNADAAWLQYDGSANRVAAATLPVGGTWAAAGPLSVAGSFADVPSLTVGATGQVRATWTRGTAVETASHFRGQPWGSVTRVGTSDAHLIPAVTVDRTDVNTIVYTNASKLFSVRRVPGGTWSSPVPVFDPATLPAGTSSTASSDASAVVKSNGSVVVGWQQTKTTGGTSVVSQTALSTFSGGHWSTAYPNGPGSGGWPLLAIDAANNVSYVWETGKTAYVETAFANGTFAHASATSDELGAARAIAGGKAGTATALFKVGSAAVGTPPEPLSSFVLR